MTDQDKKTMIKVIGCGKIGCQLADKISREKTGDFDCAAIDMDPETLCKIDAHERFQISRDLIHLINTDNKNVEDYDLYNSFKDDIKSIIKDTDIVFVVAGMGGYTGTTIAPIVAKIVKETGILTVGMIPEFSFLNDKRKEQIMQQGIKNMYSSADSVMLVDDFGCKSHNFNTPEYHDHIIQNIEKKMLDYFHCISELIYPSGPVRIDKEDIISVLKNAGDCILAVGTGDGEDKMLLAIKDALKRIGYKFKDAENVLIKFKGDSSLSLFDINDAVSVIKNKCNPNANIIFGIDLDKSEGNKVKIYLMASNIQKHNFISNSINRIKSSFKDK